MNQENNIKKLNNLRTRLFKVENEIKECQKDISNYDGRGVPPSTQNMWLNGYIEERSEILTNIKKLEQSDILKDVLLLLYDNKIDESIIKIKNKLRK